MGKTLGGIETFRAYAHGRKDGPRAMLFVDSEAPACEAPSLMITMDAPRQEPPVIGKLKKLSTMRVDDKPPVELPMRLMSVGRNQLVWSIDGASAALARARVDMSAGRFVTFELARGMDRMPVFARFTLDGYGEALGRSVRLCQAQKAQKRSEKPNGSALSKAAPYKYVKPAQLNDGIKTGDLAHAKLDRAVIEQLMNKAAGKGYRELHSVLVYRNDALVLEEYFFGNDDFIRFEDDIARDTSRPPLQWDRARKHYVASVNKALTGAIAGIALTRHQKSVDDEISRFLPARAAHFKDPNKAQLTFRHFLNMQTGFTWDEWTGTDLALMWRTKDFAEFLLSRDNRGPKSEWRYISAAPNVVLEALNNMVGGSIREFAHRSLYEPLGITDYDWQSQPGGLPEGSARLHLRPRDMLKIGILYLNGGQWNGRQIVPAPWVRETFTVQSSSDAGHYSYGFWHRRLSDIPYVAAEGDGGQVIAIFPQLDMVVVTTQGNYLEWPLYVKQAEDIMGQYVLAALQK